MRTTRITHTPLTTLNLALAATLIGLAPGCSDDSNDSNPGATDGDTETDSDSDSTDGGSGGTTAGPMPTSSAGTTPGTTTGGSESTTVDTDGETDPTTGDATTDPTTGDETDGSTGEELCEVFCVPLVEALMNADGVVPSPNGTVTANLAEMGRPIGIPNLPETIKVEDADGNVTDLSTAPKGMVERNLDPEICADYPEAMTGAQLSELYGKLLQGCENKDVDIPTMINEIDELNDSNWGEQILPENAGELVSSCEGEALDWAAIFGFYGVYVDLNPATAVDGPKKPLNDPESGWCGPFSLNNPVNMILVDILNQAKDDSTALKSVGLISYGNIDTSTGSGAMMLAFESNADVQLEATRNPQSEPETVRMLKYGVNWYPARVPKVCVAQDGVCD